MIQFIIENTSLSPMYNYDACKETVNIERGIKFYDVGNIDILFIATESEMHDDYTYYGYKLEDVCTPVIDPEGYISHVNRKAFDACNAMMAAGYNGRVMLIHRYTNKHSASNNRVLYFMNFNEFKTWAYNQTQDKITSTRCTVSSVGPIS